MKKLLEHPGIKTCCALLALAASGAAEAVYLNPQGLGEALVYPYYTVNGGQDTLFTLTNQGRDAKAVKVRFLEGYKSRDVLDVNVYLAVGDVWTAAIVANGDGAKLITSDSSCTVPDVAGTSSHSIAFTTRAFDGSTSQGKDGGPTGLSRVREGHVEVVEMGVVTSASEKALSPAPPPLDFDEFPDLAGGSPTDCSRLHTAWASGGSWSQDATTDLAAPSGGLTGSAMIVNVARGTVQGYAADALADFHLSGKGLEHTPSDALPPNLTSATSLVASTYATGAPSTLTFLRGIDAVTAAFMAGTISNEFWTSPALGANSEWVVTFPTKRFYTDPRYVGDHAAPPFENVFVAPGESCGTYFAFAEHDTNAARVGNAHSDPFLGVRDPGFSTDMPLCHATQVVTFRQNDGVDNPYDPTPKPPSRMLASNLVSWNFPFPFESGWVRFGFGMSSGHEAFTAADGQPLYGQPVTGFLAAQFVNGSVQGALANYTLALRHRTDARCEFTKAGSGGMKSFCMP